MINKKEILKIEITLKQHELFYSMLKEQLGYLRDKYPEQHVEAYIHALKVNDDKITKLKDLMEKLERKG